MRLLKYGLLHTLWETLRRPVPPLRRGYLAFGWLILLLLVVQALTGMLLSLLAAWSLTRYLFEVGFQAPPGRTRS